MQFFHSVNRGFGFFLFENGLWQQFKLQLFQSTFSIKCYITVHHHGPRQPPPDLVQQRRNLLAFLTSSINELSKPFTPESKLPVTYLECPYYHEDDPPPHIMLDISRKKELTCKLHDPVKKIDEKYYSPLYESTAVPPESTMIRPEPTVPSRISELRRKYICVKVFKMQALKHSLSLAVKFIMQPVDGLL